MPRWEYTYAHCDPHSDPVGEINKLGREGWEAFAFDPENKDHEGVFYLRRPIEEKPSIPVCQKCGTQLDESDDSYYCPRCIENPQPVYPPDRR